ncbi:peptidylprolyl isomerase [Sunxiuqinia dokdonensis]|uniref:Peptidylprolyl isomerase n=2 Tax=Sunxiuqinia dokdonensis TaxID=1409788 RepID=A0A0L8V4C9_9BACT|nr:peptidylprolyl isomerase [Sunxiuqinia dokdonensis]
MEMKINQQRQKEVMQQLFSQGQDELAQLQQAGEEEKLNLRMAEIREMANQKISQMAPLKISDERREVYTTVGGYPSLDNEYTIFGEVIEGLDVLDKLAAVETDQFNRPVNDIKMKVKVLD